MAEPFDTIGSWLSKHLGGSGTPGVSSEYVQNGPGGLHKFSVLPDKTVRDDGIIDPKSASTKPQIVKDDAGGVYAYVPTSGNPDQPFTRTTIVAPDASKAAFTQSATDRNDADVQGIYARMADAQAMLPYNKNKAQATIANLWSEVSNRSARTGIDAQKLQGQLQRWASQNGLDQSKMGLNQAHGTLYGAQADKILQGAFVSLQGEYAQIDKTVGQPGGPATQAEADDLKRQIFERVAKDAATGINGYQQATLANTAQGQAVTQADSRNTSALNFTDQAMTQAMDAAKGGAGGAASAGGFLAMLHAGQGMSSAMGGNSVNVMNPATGASLNNPDASGGMATMAHQNEIAQLVMSGQAPPDANGNRFPAAVRMVAQKYGVLPTRDQPQNYNGVGDINPATTTSGAGIFGGLNPNTPAWGPMSPGASAAAA